MESYCQCLRCGKRIPIKPQMVGQTILCPSCLERVYVTPADQAPAGSKSSASSPGSAEPTLSPSAAAALARIKQADDSGGRSLPMGLIAGVGGVAALVVVVGLVMWGTKSSPNSSMQAANSGAPAPPQAGDASGSSQLTPAPPAKAPVGPMSAEFLPKNAPAAPPPYVSSEFARQPSGAQPTTAGGKLISESSATSGANSTLPASAAPQAQSLGANWAELWHSPSTASSEPEAVASIGENPAVWKISARTYQPDFRTQPNVVVEQENDPRVWAVKYVPNAQTPQATAEKESVAVLRREGTNLVFAWASPLASAEGRRNSLNCLFDVSVGAARRIGQLREPVESEPIVLDLAAEGQKIELEIEEPPRPDALRFEIVGLSGFSSEAQVRGGVKTAMPASQAGAGAASIPGAALPGAPPAFGQMPVMNMPLGYQALPPQQVVIECEEIPGLELRVRFARAEANGKLTITIDPVLNEGAKSEYPLTKSRILETLEAEVQKPLANAQRELGPAEAGLKRWQADVEKLKANQPRAKDVQRQANWQANLKQSTDWVAKFQKEIDDLKDKIKTYQTRIEVVGKLREFIKESHQHAQIHYVVYSECGQPDLLLIDGRGK